MDSSLDQDVHTWAATALVTLEVIAIALGAGLVGGAIGGVAIGALQAWMGRGKGQWVPHVTTRGPLPVVRPATPTGPGGVGPFDRFNESAKRVLSLAQDEAIRQNHNYIGTEHLLAGVLRDGDTIAARALQSFGIELTKVRTALEFMIGRGDRTTSPSEITLSPRTKKVISSYSSRAPSSCTSLGNTRACFHLSPTLELARSPGCSLHSIR